MTLTADDGAVHCRRQSPAQVIRDAARKISAPAPAGDDLSGVLRRSGLARRPAGQRRRAVDPRGRPRGRFPRRAARRPRRPRSRAAALPAGAPDHGRATPARTGPVSRRRRAHALRQAVRGGRGTARRFRGGDGPQPDRRLRQPRRRLGRRPRRPHPAPPRAASRPLRGVRQHRLARPGARRRAGHVGLPAAGVSPGGRRDARRRQAARGERREDLQGLRPWLPRRHRGVPADRRRPVGSDLAGLRRTRPAGPHAYGRPVGLLRAPRRAQRALGGTAPAARVELPRSEVPPPRRAPGRPQPRRGPPPADHVHRGPHGQRRRGPRDARCVARPLAEPARRPRLADQRTGPPALHGPPLPDAARRPRAVRDRRAVAGGPPAALLEVPGDVRRALSLRREGVPAAGLLEHLRRRPAGRRAPQDLPRECRPPDPRRPRAARPRGGRGKPPPWPAGAGPIRRPRCRRPRSRRLRSPR